MSKQLDTLLEQLEPLAVQTSIVTLQHAQAVATVSAAISLKRIADLLTGEELPPALQSVNAYGENAFVAMQEGIVRGLRGISQY